MQRLTESTLYLLPNMLSFDNTAIAFAHKSNRALRKAYWLFKLVGNPALVKFGKVAVNVALRLNLPIGWAMRRNIFEQFCGGETIADCAHTTQVLDNYNIGTILDFSVEGKASEADFERTCEEIIRTVETAKGNPNIPFCVFKTTGIGRFALLEKLNTNQVLSPEEQREFFALNGRMERIAQKAYRTGTPVFVDAEESWIQDAIDRLTHQLMTKYNREKAIIFNTVQLYRHDRLAFLTKVTANAKAANYHYGVKLVRGAYMEKERERANDKGYPSPIQPNKTATDRDFDAAVDLCLQNLDGVAFCAGTHNEESSLRLANQLLEKGIDKNDPRVYFAQLYGMSDHISFNLSHQQFNVAKYVPYGPIREVIPYLIRRAEENTSVKGQTSRELKLILKEKSRRKHA